jgi:hypothetical protein
MPTAQQASVGAQKSLVAAHPDHPQRIVAQQPLSEYSVVSPFAGFPLDIEFAPSRNQDTTYCTSSETSHSAHFNSSTPTTQAATLVAHLMLLLLATHLGTVIALLLASTALHKLLVLLVKKIVITAVLTTTPTSSPSTSSVPPSEAPRSCRSCCRCWLCTSRMGLRSFPRRWRRGLRRACAQNCWGGLKARIGIFWGGFSARSQRQGVSSGDCGGLGRSGYAEGVGGEGVMKGDPTGGGRILVGICLKRICAPFQLDLTTCSTRQHVSFVSLFPLVLLLQPWSLTPSRALQCLSEHVLSEKYPRGGHMSEYACAKCTPWIYIYSTQSMSINL